MHIPTHTHINKCTYPYLSHLHSHFQSALNRTHLFCYFHTSTDIDKLKDKHRSCPQPTQHPAGKKLCGQHFKFTSIPSEQGKNIMEGRQASYIYISSHKIHLHSRVNCLYLVFLITTLFASGQTKDAAAKMQVILSLKETYMIWFVWGCFACQIEVMRLSPLTYSEQYFSTGFPSQVAVLRQTQLRPASVKCSKTYVKKE